LRPEDATEIMPSEAPGYVYISNQLESGQRPISLHPFPIEMAGETAASIGQALALPAKRFVPQPCVLHPIPHSAPPSRDARGPNSKCEEVDALGRIILNVEALRTVA
jgi:hypothetical protein